VNDSVPDAASLHLLDVTRNRKRMRSRAGAHPSMHNEMTSTAAYPDDGGLVVDHDHIASRLVHVALLVLQGGERSGQQGHREAGRSV
jgi:hypothetical protein